MVGIQPLVGGSLDDSGCQRVLRHRLHRRRDGQQSLLRAAHGAKLRYGRLTLCHGAGLIQHHGINGVRDLQYLAGANQNTVLRAKAGSHHDSGRSRQSQRTGAGNDQHGGEYPQNKGEILTGNGPADSRQRRKTNHRGNENARDLVSRSGNGGLFALRVLHKADDSRKRGVRAHPGDLYIQHAVFIYAAADDLAALRLFHRQALTGEHGLVDAALPLRHHTVQRNSGTGLYQQHIPGLHRRGGDLLAAVRQKGGVRCQPHESRDSALGFPHIAAFHELAQ